jgi:alanine dehydrogenase|tara:strand:- start:8 stop:1210 length:1203 start_codon:yes stop_codon:yes gene_type:complete
MKIGIIKECKTPSDKRVVFTPSKCLAAKKLYPEVEFLIQSSDVRCYSDKEYSDLGFSVVDDVSSADVLIGVKEVPIDKLIANKKYFFFSHTIKKQPYNKNLLLSILHNNIELFDHETIVDKNNNRLIGFGYYAGVVGAYNAFRALGLKNDSFILPKASELKDRKELNAELLKISIPDMKIVLTGKGRVGSGAKEILDFLQIKEVSISDYLNKSFEEAVYIQIDVLNYNNRIDNQTLDRFDFYKNPSEYKSTFNKFSSTSDMFIAGHYYDKNAPSLITLEDVNLDDFKIKLIADISCDINGPIVSTIRSSTIKDPIYGYDPISNKEVDYNQAGAITVMAVDNLPCELPRDASESFGEMFITDVLPSFFNDDKDGVLQRSKMTSKGELTDKFSYLSDFILSP